MIRAGSALPAPCGRGAPCQPPDAAAGAACRPDDAGADVDVAVSDGEKYVVSGYLAEEPPQE